MTNRWDNAARLARDEARARRRALIVTRTAYDATRIMNALENALRPRDGDTRLLHGSGLWSARSDSWGTGAIDVRVSGPAIRGITADTLLLHADATPAASETAWHTVTTSPAPVRARW